MKAMRNEPAAAKQAGFTLIELVIVIVIIGILAAVAIPNFSDVTTDAKKSTASGIASTLAAAAAANWAICQGNLANATCVPLNTVNTCSTALSVLVPGTGGTAAAGTNAGTCTVTYSGQTSAAVAVKGT